MKDGVRLPYVLELDHELTVVSEYADTTDVDHVRDGRRAGRGPRVPASPARRMSAAVARWAAAGGAAAGLSS